MSCENNIEDLWDKYSGEFNKKLVYECGGDWNKLDRDEREIAALWKLCADTNNGGFEQFFTNWGYECYWYAMCGIKRMGCTELLERLHYTYTDVFDKFREDERLTYYSEILQYLTDEDEEMLMDLNTSFWETNGEELMKRAYKFYHDELEKTIGGQ